MSAFNLAGFTAWEQKAEEDHAAAAILIQHGGPPATICFLCQQIAEKYLKAFSVYNGRPVKHIHQLDMLLEDCIALEEGFGALVDAVTVLKQYYIESRYPDDLPERIPESEAAAAWASASRVRNLVRTRVQNVSPNP